MVRLRSALCFPRSPWAASAWRPARFAAPFMAGITLAVGACARPASQRQLSRDTPIFSSDTAATPDRVPAVHQVAIPAGKIGGIVLVRRHGDCVSLLTRERLCSSCSRPFRLSCSEFELASLPRTPSHEFELPSLPRTPSPTRSWFAPGNIERGVATLHNAAVSLQHRPKIPIHVYGHGPTPVT